MASQDVTPGDHSVREYQWTLVAELENWGKGPSIFDQVSIRDEKDNELATGDWKVVTALGVAMSKAQELEIVLVRLLEAQRQDLSLPLDDRWAEISDWLDMTAGQLRRIMGVPEPVAADLQAAVGRRNRVAHDAWMLYSAGEDSRASADTWARWLEEEAATLGQVVEGVARLRDRVKELRTSGGDLGGDELVRVWRRYVPNPVAPRPDRDPGGGG